MKYRALAFAVAALLAACSGNFGTGTSIPQQGGGVMPPQQVGNSPMPQTNDKGLPQNGGANASPLPSPGTFAIADAQNGFVCPPTTDGYACKLTFNLPPPTPEPSPAPTGKAKHKATPTPSPSPTPTPSPSPEASGSASPSPSPTPHGTVTLKAQALPADAPKMVHIPDNSLDVVPLMMVTLSTNADFTLDGWVNAQFMLPKEQLTDRGFAVQLFSASTKKRGTSYTPLWTFDNSTLDTDTLTFSFKPEKKLTIGKGSTYVLVLYGDDKSKTGSPAPDASVSATPGASVSATPSPSASPSE